MSANRTMDEPSPQLTDLSELEGARQNSDREQEEEPSSDSSSSVFSERHMEGPLR